MEENSNFPIILLFYILVRRKKYTTKRILNGAKITHFLLLTQHEQLLYCLACCCTSREEVLREANRAKMICIELLCYSFFVELPVVMGLENIDMITLHKSS